MLLVAAALDLLQIMAGCGYPFVTSVSTLEQLHAALAEVQQQRRLSFIEVKCALGSRADLGRPNTSAAANKRAFMAALQAARA